MKANSQLTTRIITPVSGLDSFREILRSLIAEHPIARELAWRFFLRDIRAEYRQSLLGYLWLFLPPIATTAVWIFLNSQQIVTIDSGPVPYPLFVLIGTILWGAFNGALVTTIGVIGEARATISKLNFPHEALLIAAVYKILLNTGIQSLLLIPAFLVFSFVPGPGALFLPVGLLALILLGAAIGVFLIPMGTLYSDVSRGIQLILRFAFFVTPVVYPIPDTNLGKILATINPVAPLLVTTRSLATGGEAPAWIPFAAIVAGSLLLLAVSIVVYKLALPRLIERLSA